MQTSRDRCRGFAKYLVLAIVFVLTNALLTFARAPYGSKSQLAWSDYALQAHEELDTVIVGSSTVMAGIDPFVLDDELSAQAYNLATPDQWLEESFVAIRTAYEDHGIKRVVLGLTHAQVLREGSPNPSSAFMFRRSQVVSLRQHLDGMLYLLFDGGAIAERESIAMFFPWVSNHVDNSVSATMRNLRMKCDGTTLYEAAAVSESGWTYHGKGFGTYNGTLNYNTKSTSYFSQDKRGDVGKTEENSGTLNENRKRTLVGICDYCTEHGIELVAVSAPMPAYNVIEYGENYFVVEEELRSLLEKHGARFFDLNLAKPELLELDESLFRDTEHMNADGAEASSRALCELVKRTDAGEDVRGLFFSGEEYLRSVNSISCVFVDSVAEADGVHVAARAMAGSAVQAEYQYLRKAGDEWVVLRDWSDDPTFVFVPDGGERGSFELCVNARKVESDVEYDRYRKFTVLY